MRKTKDHNRLARERIVAALTELMSTRDYASITITEITQKAGVSRMTYYRNYSSKEDILRKFMDDVGESIHKKIVEQHLHKDVYQYYYTLFDTLAEYAPLVNTALNAGLGGLILDCIARNMDLTFLGAGEQREQEQEQDREQYGRERYLLRYHAGAFFHVFIDWNRRGRLESSAQMAKLCTDASTGKICFPDFS